MKVQTLTPEDVASLLRYDPDTGSLYWLHRENAKPGWNTRYAGKQAFTAKRKDGYFWGSIHNKQYLAHRVAYALHFGEWPDVVDHINGLRHDNRLCNLRSVTFHENCMNGSMSSNNCSGYNGVYWSSRWGKWKAMASVRGRSYALGTFNCPTAAAVSRIQANRRLGFSENHGKAKH